jgi:Transposase DDE domain
MLARSGFLWCQPTHVTQQAMSQRFLSFPAQLFEGVFKKLLPTLRLIEVRSGNTWHSYLTSVLDPQILPPYVVADLYRRRWRIEEAFNTVFTDRENQDLGIVKRNLPPRSIARVFKPPGNGREE